MERPRPTPGRFAVGSRGVQHMAGVRRGVRPEGQLPRHGAAVDRHGRRQRGGRGQTGRRPTRGRAAEHSVRPGCCATRASGVQTCP
eukprot:16429158-Heterocapsa_arctica.AAC.1